MIELGAVERRMLELKPSPTHFGEISNISPISSEDSITPVDPHGNSPVLSPHDTSPQGSKPRIDHGSTGAPSLSDEAKTTAAPSVFNHAPVSYSSAPVSYTTSNVTRTSRPVLEKNEVTDVESTSLLLQTADPADVASLSEKSTGMTDDYANYYWVGDLSPVVNQTSESLFTTSPGEVFAHLIDRIYDIDLKDSSAAQQWNRHHILNSLYPYFMKDGYALSWARFVDEDRTKRVGHLRTMTVCKCEYHEFETMGKEHQLLVATAGVIDALQNLSDQKGMSRSMSPTLPPIISEKRLFAHITYYIARPRKMI